MASRPYADATTGKQVEFGLEAREEMLEGIKRIGRAVSVTLGPKGRNVVIRRPGGESQITKDGVTVARAICLSNQRQDVGARLIRQVASKTNDVAGDGTTTATVLAWTIFAEGYKSVATGANPMDLKRGIDAAVNIILDSLETQTRKINSLAELQNVATISANGERKLGELIADAVQSVGANGFIAVLDGRTGTTTWQRHDGYSVEHGFASSALLTDSLELKCDVSNALVLVSRKPLAGLDDVLPFLEVAVAQKRPIVFAAPDFDAGAMDTIVANHKAGVVKACAVRIADVEELADVAVTCGCRALDEWSNIHDFAALLGTAVTVEQSMDTTILKGAADTMPRVRFLEKKLERAESEAERDHYSERIAKLSQLFAVIRVGGQTTVEARESKDRVIDALNASRAALSDGIVAGGGAALIYCSLMIDDAVKAVEDDDDASQDRKTGLMIVRNAARLPIRFIADNAGVEGPVIAENVMDYRDAKMGYDAQNDKYVDMFEAGIIDPVRVVRSCIRDASSVAGLMITTEAVVNDEGTEPINAKIDSDRIFC
jgi:chaperonin GroL